MRAPGDINAVFDHSQAVFWLADFNYRNGDFDAAEVRIRPLRRADRPALRRRPGPSRFTKPNTPMGI
jgi:hypothetical protein